MIEGEKLFPKIYLHEYRLRLLRESVGIRPPIPRIPRLGMLLGNFHFHLNLFLFEERIFATFSFSSLANSTDLWPLSFLPAPKFLHSFGRFS